MLALPLAVANEPADGIELRLQREVSAQTVREVVEHDLRVFLYSLTATCEANGVEPIAHLTDVLGRVGSYPAAMLDQLLPHKWCQSA